MTKKDFIANLTIALTTESGGSNSKDAYSRAKAIADMMEEDGAFDAAE